MNHQSSLNLLAAVALVALAGFTSNAKAVTVGNPSFELYDALTHGDWGGVVSPDDPKVVWTFSHYGTDVVGIDNNRLIWYPVAVPDGTAAAYLQSTSSISQPVTFDTAGDYTVSFSVIGRHGGHGPCDMTVMIDGEPVLSLTAADISTAAWQTKVSNIFTVTAGTHTIAFATDSKVNGATVSGKSNAIDNVVINMVSAADMLTFGPGAAISGTSIAWTVPYETNLATLASIFTMSPGATCNQPNGAAPTPNFSTGPVHYIVTAAGGGSSKDYTVTVTKAAPSTACDMLTFGPGAVISGTDIAWEVPFSADLATLAPTFTLSPFATCVPASGSTVDFSSGTALFTTMAQDGVTTQDYTVTVTKAPFGLVNVGNPSFEKYDALTHGSWGGILSSSDPKVVWTFSHYGTDVVGIDNNRLIWYPVAVPDGTAAAYLQSTSSISQPVTFDTAGDYTVSFSVIGRHEGHGPCDMTVMIDGESVLSLTASDISTAAWQTKVSNIFTVTAGTHTIAFATDSKVNGVITGGRSNAIDMVEIKMAAADQADMISCTFPDLGPATIDGTEVSITVPYGTEVTALAPTFTLSPFATSSPPSGTERDFTLPQFYMVRSGDWSNTKIYTVTVNVTPASTACDILTFGSVGNPALISDTEIDWTVPYSTDLEMLSPSFTLSPNATCDQYSGEIPFPDFSTGPVPYVVTAEDGVTTKTYTVTVTKAPASSACEMLAFGLPGNPAVISGTDITWTVPHGTELTTLAASFAVSPFAVCDQLNHSIPTPDFSTGPVLYKVTAEDGVTTNDYTVTITVGPQVNFTLTPLGKTADSTGSEILNSGILIKAYHFGNGPVDTTVSGVVFTAGNSGTGPSYPATGLSGSSNGMKGWLSGQLGYSFTNAAYAELIDQAYVGGSPVMTVGGLTVGHEYRLQIILQDTRGTPTIEGVTGLSLTPGNPGVITATWVAKDDTLNVSWSGGASPHFSGYALHDMGGGTVPDYDTWANSFGAAFTDRDPASDPDGDGMSNQEEYAFGLNPTSGSSVNPITVPLDMTSGTFSYTRRNPALTGLGYAVLTSTDLLNWMPNGAGGSQTPDSPAAEVQTVTVVVDATPLNGRLFVRVQASD